MYKKLLIPIFIIFLFAFLVNAQTCLNNDDCSSGVCQGGECRAEDIRSLLTTAQQCGTKAVEDSCLNDDECQSCVCQGGECREADITDLLNQPVLCGDGDCDDSIGETCSTCQADCGSCPGSGGSGGSSSGSSGSSVGAGGTCIPNWDCTLYSACVWGKKTRTCTDLNQCDPPLIYGKPAEEINCEPPVIATCNDGILNQNEEGVDCGGPCSLCATCFDEIENCHDGTCETGVDCGGSCMPCSWWKASGKASFWIILITGLLVLIILVLGIWYWKLKAGAEHAGKQMEQFMKRPPQPPMQPSSMLRI